MLRQLPRRTIDLAVVAALAVLAVVDLAVPITSNFAASAAVNLLFLLACVVPLVWRVREPLKAFVAYLAVSAVYVLSFYRHTPAPFTQFVVGIVASFALGRYANNRQLGVGLAVFAAVLVVVSLVQLAAGQHAGDVVPAIIWWSLAIAAGRFVRDQGHRLVMLGDRAASLEREREAEAARATLEERARIARELHDVIAHSVSVMVIQAGVERRTLGPGQESTGEALRLIEDSGRDVLGELRRLLGVMRAPGRSPSLSPQPGLENLDALIEECSRTGQVVDVRVDGTPHALPAGADLAAYRIIQEALTNARRHAPGANVVLTLRWSPRELGMEIVDDGPGPPAVNGSPGHGLVGMRERASLYAGSVQTGPAGPNGGYRVRARLPIEERRP